MASSLKETKVKLDLLTVINMSLMVQKGIRGGIRHAIHRYVKANNNGMKDYDKNKESSYLKYWDVNNLYGSAVSKKLPVNGFKWVENTSQFSQDFIENYHKTVRKDILLKFMFNTLKAQKLGILGNL